jgi:UDP-N-acetylmuramate dehydrogenase
MNAAEPGRLEGLFRPAVRGRLLAAEPLRAFTSFRVGGAADLLFFPADRADLVAALRVARAGGVPVFVMGNGTNLLVGDRGIRGLVVHTGALEGIGGGEVPAQAAPGTPVALRALAGTLLSRVINFTVSRGLTGLEWAVGIPGTVGGAIVMNAGASGSSIADAVRWVELVDAAGEEFRLERAEIEFRYRGSRLPRPGIVLEAGLELAWRGEAPVLDAVKRLLAERERRLPFGWGNAGSVFKNPPGDYAGRLIEAAGCKGLRVGGAEVSAKHANVIVNVGQATAADIHELMRLVAERVAAASGVTLEAEIQMVGEA